MHFLMNFHSVNAFLEAAISLEIFKTYSSLSYRWIFCIGYIEKLLFVVMIFH